MDLGALVEQLLDRPADCPAIGGALPVGEAAALVAHLKAEADRHWWINANRSLALAELIVQIGQARGEGQHTALGLMARGDALKFLGRNPDAWQALAEAGQMFQAAGDEVGWARTWIGRLLICVDLNRVAEALAGASQARTILTRWQVLDKRLALDINAAIVHHLLGDYRQSLLLYQQALASVEAAPQIGQQWLGAIHTNIGYVYDLLGDFRQAAAHNELARICFAERNETRGVALAEFNSAHIAMAQGHYRHALSLLQRAYDHYSAEQLGVDAAHVNRDRVECYLLLNRLTEARDLARSVCATYRANGASYREALTLLHLATAEAELGEPAAAHTALDAAEAIFVGLGADTWSAIARLRRGTIALRQGAPGVAEREASSAAASFAASGRLVDQAEATLLRGRALLALGDSRAAAEDGAYALGVARRCNIPPLRYSAHLHRGYLALAQRDERRAARCYRAALATIARVQQGLTITMRPGFLENKGEALRALMGLYLRRGEITCAFEALEQAKSQVALSYIANRDHLRWPSDNPQARLLLDELDQLRAEHHWFYQLAHGQPATAEAQQRAIGAEQARGEIAAREQRMRAITEQLYLLNDIGLSSGRDRVPSLRDVQRRLDDDTLLIEFYNDGARLWAFTVSGASAEVHPLAATTQDLSRWLDQLQLNMRAALRVGPHAPLARRLCGVAQGLLQQFYGALLAPLAAQLAERQRLVIVPYGALHYLPFHLLHSGAAYLIEQHEVVILPAAGLATRPPAPRPPGALVLAHSANGQLAHTATEARIVQRLFGGTLYDNDAAVRPVLRARPAQILHIAAHGEHRLDQPDLSYIQLADGQLYADDLLQQDLSYELVTLSACETGRAAVAAGDELIGLGRGFLYAGAGALITSLWRVGDAATLALMEQLYQALRAGYSKAAALRCAQQALLATEPALHPAFWGAFQLVGDARPLSAPAQDGQAVESRCGRQAKGSRTQALAAHDQDP